MSMIADSLKSRTSFSPEKESRLSSMDVHMSEKAFRESLVYLGLSPYYDGFIAEAFDSWAVLSAITEADLDALGVKLGHRRVLQRAITEYHRGGRLGMGVSHPNAEGGDKTKQSKGRIAPGCKPVGGIQPKAKRKYTRHCKPDENAPARPRSAYVLFSNQVRASLSSQDLNFTDLAKTVGERWQALAPEEKAVFETRGQAMKDEYHRLLALYKVTMEYREYQQYLRDFKARQRGSADGMSASRLNSSSFLAECQPDDKHRGQDEMHFRSACDDGLDERDGESIGDSNGDQDGEPHLTHQSRCSSSTTPGQRDPLPDWATSASASMTHASPELHATSGDDAFSLADAPFKSDPTISPVERRPSQLPPMSSSGERTAASLTAQPVPMSTPKKNTSLSTLEPSMLPCPMDVWRKDGFRARSTPHATSGLLTTGPPATRKSDCLTGRQLPPLMLAAKHHDSWTGAAPYLSPVDARSARPNCSAVLDSGWH